MRLGFVAFAALALYSAGADAQTSPLERGKYLATSIAACGSCHTPKGPGPGGEQPGMELAGGFVIRDDAFTAVTANITSDKETGIGNWTDAQIVTAIREGKRPDGTIIGPPMPIEFYRQLSDTDVTAIVAYLRSVKPVSNKVGKSTYNMPLPASYGPPVGHVADVSPADPVKYGAYLAGPVGHCMECHTPMVKGELDLANQAGRGGRPFGGPNGPVVSRNITPHKEDGIGGWSDAEIKRAITQGISKDGSKLSPPMSFAYYARMSDSDLNAILAYLKTLKPLTLN